MKIIGTANVADYQAWYSRAIVDEGVWPYLAVTPYYRPIKIEDGDWDNLVVMDDSGVGCCVLSFDRNTEHSASLCLWVLSVPTKAVVVASLLRDALAVGARYDLRWLDTTCHESNAASRAANEKFFGKPWGIKPNGAWNGLRRTYEAKHHYRAAVRDIEARFEIQEAA